MECLSRLNSLQSNSKTLEMLRKSGNKMNSTSISEMNDFCSRTDISAEKLSKMPIVHVAGTKGKGSTAAFIESLFRFHGLKTGLFTSPHLRHVNERIRINGKPISNDLFQHNFDYIWNKLDSSGGSKPSYFRYLTLMGLHTFMDEKVDVCVVEVGVGGRYDGTNIIKSPIACVITPIGMDHVATLGDTLSKIAHHKAGIIKPNSTVFSGEQFEESFRVIEDECLKNYASLVKWTSNHSLLDRCSIVLQHQLQNATTAINTFQHAMKVLNRPVSEQLMIEAINQTNWPGRNQVIQYTNKNYYLDGAHTVESLMYCIDWYKENSKNIKILVFSCTPERLNATLISLLKNVDWNFVVFTNTKTFKTGYAKDLLNKSVNYYSHHFEQLQHYIPESVVTDCIEDAIKLINDSYSECKVDVLCTGSLHLVGGVMELLDVPIE